MTELEKKLKHYRLSFFEYQQIQNLLGRDPRGIEWAIFSALWSEHCSYKSSKVHLRKFAYPHPRVKSIEGENAGIIDLGQGEMVAFKMESHNHPSFIEPVQGAATGVGGILRDIFTMGARPILLADYLCFGRPEAPRMKSLMAGVVHGISSYGNCVGVPTCTGYTESHESYDNNILVNALALGLITSEMNIALSGAKGVGNWIVYVGAKTGKDGIHGASMASESFGENTEAKKPNVQIGDPFYEKLLIESCLEVLKENLVVAMQDMGAAGLTSSSFEMSAKGGVGFDIDLNKVPLRENSLSPEEILLSESQERMLLICEPKNFDRIKNIFNKWNLEAEKIGEVIESSRVRLKWNGETIFDLDPQIPVGQAPRYERPYDSWISKSLGPLSSWSQQNEPLQDLDKDLKKLLNYMKSPQGADKSWIYQQYDQRVGLRTAWGSEHSIAIQRLPSGRYLSVALGCRPTWMRKDARVGAYDSVFYPALKMAIKGFKALGITDCLNFASPERKEIMTEFVASVEAIAESARLLDAPVISGNVSFYNETQGRGITSTPAIGMIGIREKPFPFPEDAFLNQGECVYRLSFLQVAAGDKDQFFGEIHPQKTRDFLQLALALSEGFSASQVVGHGGLWVTLMEMSGRGISIDLDSEFRITPLKVSGGLYQVIFSTSKSSDVEVHSQIENFFKSQRTLETTDIEFEKIGTTRTAFMRYQEKVVAEPLVELQIKKNAWINHWSEPL